VELILRKLGEGATEGLPEMAIIRTVLSPPKKSNFFV